MDDDRRQRIVAGVSGSLASRAALEWAAGEARLRDAALHAVHVWDPAPCHASYALLPGPTREQLGQAARGQLATVLGDVFGPAPPSWVTAELAEGMPERVLVQRSTGTCLLVIGAADQAGLPAGPVVRACLRHSGCPLVIISGPGQPAGLTRHGGYQPHAV